MPRPRDRQSLLDILANIRLIQAFLANVAWEAFRQDVGRQYQVIHALEIIGEAARRLSPTACAAIPAVPWQDWVAFRNRLSHAYDDVNLEIVWDTVTLELPPLTIAIEDALTRKLPGE